jgi:hypothetical protein
MAVQAVAAVRRGQQLQVRFELPPRLRLEGRGEVMWADSGGQCGIRFFDLPPGTAQRVDEWILADLRERVPLHSRQTGTASPGSGLAAMPPGVEQSEDDGLIISPSPVKVIELPTRLDSLAPDVLRNAEPSPVAPGGLDWLSQPLSRRAVVWLVNSLTVVAALLLFALIFLSVTRETPKWPAAMVAGAAVAVAALYWGFFRLFGGISPGAQLARLMDYDATEDEESGSAL